MEGVAVGEFCAAQSDLGGEPAGQGQIDGDGRVDCRVGGLAALGLVDQPLGGLAVDALLDEDGEDLLGAAADSVNHVVSAVSPSMTVTGRAERSSRVVKSRQAQTRARPPRASTKTWSRVGGFVSPGGRPQ